MLAQRLSALPWVKQIFPVETNIVIFEVENSEKVTAEFAKRNIRIQPFSPTLLRMVTHLDFTEEMLGETIAILTEIKL